MKLKDKIINAIGEDLKEYGFEYNKKDIGERKGRLLPTVHIYRIYGG